MATRQMSGLAVAAEVRLSDNSGLYLQLTKPELEVRIRIDLTFAALLP